MLVSRLEDFMDATHCPSCAGAVPFPRPMACMYCGTVLPQAAEQTLPAAPATPDQAREERFEALAHHPAMPGILASTAPSAVGEIAGGGFRVIFGLIFAGVALFILTMTRSVGAPGFFMLIPGFFIIVGLAISGSSLYKTASLASASVEKRAARVVDERVQVSGGGENSSASTTYYVLLELRDGSRQEYKTSASVAGNVARDDMGIAFIKGGLLLDFLRVEV